MTEPLLWLLALGPLALATVAMIPRHRANRRPLAVAGLTWAASLGALLLVVIASGALLATGTGVLRTGTLGVAGVGLALQLDALSATIALLVAFVGSIVARYSRNYLAGDPNHGAFMQGLSLTLASVLFLILSGNLFQLALAWTATSLSLHRLLLFYPTRPAAILAARKKFIAGRLGDLCMVAAMLLAYRAFGSLDFQAIQGGAQSLRGAASIPGGIHALAALLVVAGLLKSAQFPLHGWLLEVMETPTPVSALLHAGIINAGGFLLLRFADVLILSGPSMNGLLLAGSVTALFGSLVLMTQTSVKVTLAYSTIAQMGFMMLQIGLGAFSAALLHLVAHSLYKAHAFLSSGSVIDLQRASPAVARSVPPHPARLLLAVALVLSLTLAVGAVAEVTLSSQPGVLVLGAIVMLGLIHLLSQALDRAPRWGVLARVTGLAAAVAIAYFGLQWLAAWLMAGVLPPTLALRGPLDLVILAIVVFGFAAITVVQGLLPGRLEAPFWQRWHAHVSNGFYVNTLANRWVLRFWPTGPARSTRAKTAGQEA
ncbi:proton-conducting transporter transmembrane domain-containing protein [Arenimonas alkanexedens]